VALLVSTSLGSWAFFGGISKMDVFKDYSEIAMTTLYKLRIET
jgi:hypothetical protein